MNLTLSNYISSTKIFIAGALSSGWLLRHSTQYDSSTVQYITVQCVCLGAAAACPSAHLQGGLSRGEHRLLLCGQGGQQARQ